jgi:muconolactone delta-isomerase
MRFLVVTEASAPFPPEMALGMVEGMKQWSKVHRDSGKIEQIWSFAGIGGGGGILNVDSHEELDAIMAGFPFGPFSHIDIYPLADLDAGLTAFAQAIGQMMNGMQGSGAGGGSIPLGAAGST